MINIRNVNNITDSNNKKFEEFNKSVDNAHSQAVSDNPRQHNLGIIELKKDIEINIFYIS